MGESAEVKGRFAPSPTGFLHAGNARTALMAACWCSSQKGTFVLRIDDTDSARSEDGYVQALREDLEWLGINFHASFYQSQRGALYQEVSEDLKKKGRLYPCYETKEELEEKRAQQLKDGKPPRYDRSALRLSQEELSARQAKATPPHWRFKLSGEKILWNDAARGKLGFDLKNLSDPIVVRENGAFSFLLSGAADDLHMHTTQILRGEDHIANTAVQIDMMQAMAGPNAALPSFAHVSLLRSPAGGVLSKRLGSGSIRDLRAQGFEPAVVRAWLLSAGLSAPVLPEDTLSKISQKWTVSAYGQSQPLMDLPALRRANALFLSSLNWSDAKKRLSSDLLQTVTQDFWQVVQDSLLVWSDLLFWNTVCFQDALPENPGVSHFFLSKKQNDKNCSYPISYQDVLKNTGWTAADLAKITIHCMPKTPWDQNSWSAWLASLKEKTSLSGKMISLFVRSVLTGVQWGPRLGELLPFMSPQHVVRKFQHAL